MQERLMLSLAMLMCAWGASAEPKTADDIAKELANPAGSLASLAHNIVYTTYKGGLPNADDQDAWSYQFQPVLP